MIKVVFNLFIYVFLIASCNNQASSVERPKIKTEESKDSIRYPLLISEDQGLTWTSASQGLPADLQVSFLEPMGDEIVIATDNAGIYISAEKRSVWTAIGEMLPNKKINALHISDEIIYAGVYRKGIFYSKNRGLSWESLNFDLHNLSVQAIWKLKDDLYVGTDQGISKFSENDQSWERLPLNVQVLSLYEEDGRFVAGTSQGTSISFDKGDNWEVIRAEGAVHYTHNIGSRIVELALNGDLNFSDDWGKTWIEATYQPREMSYIYELISIDEYYILSNNYGIHRSSDQGKTWKNIYKTEAQGFFDLLVIDNKIYGGTRDWDEYRKRE